MNTKYLFSSLTAISIVSFSPIARAQTNPLSTRIPVADSSRIGTQVLQTTNNNFTITGGVNLGQNLLHSFTDFSVPTGGGATFDNSLGKQSIITRVTGGNFSDIDGLVNTQGANFFLINPNGIVFGTNAQLNVGQTFVGSTANGIDLVDGGGRSVNFGTNRSGDAELLTINPNALFNVSRLNMGGGNGQISNFGTLQTTNPNQYIGLIGGNVTLDGGKIIAPGGRVDLGGLNSTGTVNINSTGLVFSGNGLNPSDVTLTNGGLVTVRANQPMGQVNLIFSNEQTLGSSLNINARNVNLIKAGTASGNTLAALDAGLETNSGVQTVAAGDININATGTLTQDNSQIKNTIRPGSQGQIGDIKISTNDLKATNGAQISGVTAGQGNAGSVKITATGNVSFDGTGNSLSSGVNSGVLQNAVGNGGIVEINTRNLSLTNGSQLQAEIRGQGDGGGIKITATGEVYIDGTKDGFISGVYSNINQGGIGKGGIVEINTRNLSVKNGGEIAASTFGQGDAGAVKITATEDISFDGFTNYGFPSGAFSEVKYEGVGKGGLIEIKARNLSLTNGAELVVSTYRPGDAGIIKINATDKILLDGFGNGVPSGAFSTVHPAAVGNGGGIEINTRSLEATNGAVLSSITSGQGNAGTVKITATENISFDGIGGDLPSGVLSSVQLGAVGNGGGVEINTQNLSLTNGAQLVASTSGQGNAGNVSVIAKNVISLIGQPTAIFSTVEAGGVGKGGTIDIKADSLSIKDGANLLTITRGASTTQPAGQGSAGNVNVIVTGAVNISGKNVFSSGILSFVDTGSKGDGGNITVDAGSFSLRDGAKLVASTGGQGNAGTVKITATGDVFFDGFNGLPSGAFSTVENGANGKGGDVKINSQNLSVTNGAQLTTSTSGQGNAGNITIKVGGAVNIFSPRNGFPTGLRSEASIGAFGNGGNITVEAGSLSLQDNAALSSSTFGKGDAGNITVKANDGVSLAKGFTQIFSTVEAGGVGKGGNIDIKAGSLSLQDGAHQLGTFTRGASTTQPAGQGDAGNINVKVTGAVDISGTKDGFFSAINSFVDTGTVGNGGNITVDTGSLSLRDGTQLQAATLGQGNAGTITVNATDFFTIAGNSGLFVNSQSQTGTAGDIIVTSPKIILDRGILASASLSGNGGNIQIGGKLPVQVTSIKEGSQINPAETKLLLLRRDGQITTNAFGTDRQGSNGGNITITAPNGFIVTAPNENSDISANGFSGSGGKVTINTKQNFWISPLSRAELEKQLGTGEPSLLDPSRLPTNDITAISQVDPTLNGQVTTTPPEIDPSRGLSPLPNSVTDPTNQINPNCSAKAIANNSFTSVGRGGIPATPKDPLNEQEIATNWVRINPQDTRSLAPPAATLAPATQLYTSAEGKPIVEAQAWRRERNGDIVLVSTASGNLSRPPQPQAGCVDR